MNSRTAPSWLRVEMNADSGKRTMAAVYPGSLPGGVRYGCRRRLLPYSRG